MKHPRLLTRPVALAVLLLTMLGAGVPAAAARPTAAPNALTEPTSLAVAAAASPATGHLFILSQDYQTPTQFVSAVSMLDARTGQLVHVTRGVGRYARGLLVDDASHHLFVIMGGVFPNGGASEPLRVLILDTRTGVTQRTVDLGPGALQGTWVAGRLGQLAVALTPGVGASATGPGVIHILDTKTGATVHTLPYPRGDTEFATHQATATLCVVNTTSSTVRLYDTHTWQLKATVHLEQPWASVTGIVADEAHGTVAMVTGKQTSITFVRAATGAVVRTLQLKNASPIVNLVVDDQTGHLFAISVGTATKQESVTDQSVTIVGGQDGVVTTVDRATGTVLRSQPLGWVAWRAAVDARTQHLFVVSYGRVGTRTGRVTITSTLVNMLDTRTGALIRATTIPFAPDPESHDLVVDAQAGRAYFTSVPYLWQGKEVDNTVMLLDTRTGAVVRTVVLPEPAA